MVKADKGSTNLSRLQQASKGVTQATAGVVASTKSGKSQIEDTGEVLLGMCLSGSTFSDPLSCDAHVGNSGLILACNISPIMFFLHHSLNKGQKLVITVVAASFCFSLSFSYIAPFHI